MFRESLLSVTSVSYRLTTPEMEKELHNPELERKRPRRAADVTAVFFDLSVLQLRALQFTPSLRPLGQDSYSFLPQEWLYPKSI